nr:MAG TPA_asm: hypothetical protein [Caudoviricetes sp.]
MYTQHCIHDCTLPHHHPYTTYSPITSNEIKRRGVLYDNINYQINNITSPYIHYPNKIQ